MEKTMKKTISFEESDLALINKLIKFSDARIDRILEQFAEDKTEFEALKLATTLLLEFNRPFFKEEKLELKPGKIYVRSLATSKDEYWIFETSSAPVPVDEANRIYVTKTGKYRMDPENGPCVWDVKLYKAPTTGVGRLDADVKEATAEQCNLFMAAVFAKRQEDKIKEREQLKASDPQSGEIYAKGDDKSAWIFKLLCLKEDHSKVIIYEHLLRKQPNRKVKPMPGSNCSGIGYWTEECRPATLDEQQLYLKYFPNEK